MNDTNMACFLSVVKTGNISLTARMLSISQQAVSRNIQKLEEEFGYELLKRQSNNISLTYAGEEFYKYLSDLDKKLENAAMIAPWMDDGLNIGWTELSDYSIRIHDSIGEMRRIHPDLKLNFLYGDISDILDMYNNGFIDIAILPEENIGSVKRLSLQRFFEELDLYIIVSKDHPLAAKDIPLEKIKDYPLFLVCESDDRSEDLDFHIRKISEAVGMRFENIITVSSYASMFSEMKYKNGFSIYPKCLYCTDDSRFYARKLYGCSETFMTIRPIDNTNKWVEEFEHILHGGNL